MTPAEIYAKYLIEVTNLYNSAVKQITYKYNSEKHNHKETPGLLSEILIASSLRNEFTEKYPISNVVLHDSKGNIIHNSPELDRHIHKMYKDLLDLPDELISQ
jgi:hypothetical protein